MKELLEKCAERRLLLHPETVNLLEGREIDDSLVSRVFSLPEGTVVTPDLVKGNGEDAGEPPRPKRTRTLEVLSDSTGESVGEGQLEDFRSLFYDRLERLRGILENRQGINPRRIDTVPDDLDRGIKVVGMVRSVSRTGNGNFLIRLEDEGGELPAIVPSRDESLMGLAEGMLEDEVVGVTGKVRRGSDLLIVEDIVRPGVPMRETGGDSDVYAAFLSDLHVGSESFLREELEAFFSWLRGEIGDERQREIASRTGYLLAAGDIVEGIGVYPGQERTLTTRDLLEQYEEAARILEGVPDDIEVVLSPGNHDAVRQAEPQPALRDEYAEVLDMKNVTLVSNPALLDLDGFRVLIYHGRSLDDIVAKVPEASYRDPVGAMEGLLQRRHLAPTYGGNTPLSPEKEDHLVIDQVPDALHSGHVHTFGMGSYRGVTVVNSGTWQSQTDFQKRMGIDPDPGRAPLINLSTGERKILRFA